jgi:serine/threonine-protein kinase
MKAPDPVTRLNAALGGRYRIERELGEGGMATVYLADDLKHERKVALKVLKPELAAVIGAERFLAEIKTTANLQHPHILPLHDSGEADGLLFYVMPYVEGENLRERLDRDRQLGVDEAVGLATKVAAALQAAHERGVIHRDIKPANILLSKGEPLISDFGIALAVSAGGAGRLTETGLSLGTPHYMSPEQATGDQSVGAATDIYALGCVLYEMLVGEPPYTGNSPQAILGKIIQAEAVSATKARHTVPTSVDAVIRKALEKVPADRFKTVREFADALSDDSFHWGALPSPPAGVTARGRRDRTRVVVGASLSLAALAIAWNVFSTTRAEVEWQRIELWSPGAFGEGYSLVRYYSALAPDGSAIAFADTATGELLLKRPDELDPVPVAGATSVSSPVFSPDGEWIAYFSEGALMKIPVRGGAPLRLADSVATGNREAAWLDDGSILFNRLGWNLSRVSQDGGGAERLTTGEAGFITGMTALPESRGVLLSTCDNQCPNPAVGVFDLETEEYHVLLPGAVRAYYLDTGHLFYGQVDGSLFVAPFDLANLQLTGSGVPVLNRVATRPQSTDFKLGADGTLLYLQGDAVEVAAQYHLAWVSRTGEVEVVDPEFTGNFATLALAPDDQRAAVEIQGDGGGLWVKELPSGPVTKLSVVETQHRRPEWSHDGTGVYWQTASTDSSQYFIQRRSDASDAVANFLQLDRSVLELTISADGGSAVARVGGMGNGPELWVVRHAGDTVPKRILGGDYDVLSPTLSPDGRWLAYVSSESGQREVYVRPFPDVDAARHTLSVLAFQLRPPRVRREC